VKSNHSSNGQTTGAVMKW